MTKIEVFAGMDPATGLPLTRREHPFFVFGPRPKMDRPSADGTPRKTKTRIAVYRKGGPRRETVPAYLTKLDPSISRQVRRQAARQQAKFSTMES